MKKKDKFIEEVKRSLGRLDEASAKDDSIKKILKRFKDGKISLERADALIKKVTEAFALKGPKGYKGSKRSKPTSSTCSPPSRSC